jgi:hypothetical protein
MMLQSQKVYDLAEIDKENVRRWRSKEKFYSIDAVARETGPLRIQLRHSLSAGMTRG